MPEGDTVHRTAVALDRALTGHTLTLTDFRVPALATVDLTGGVPIRTISRGKHLLTRIDHDQAWTLHTHLKMEGSWHLYAGQDRWRRPTEQARVVLGIEGRSAVGFSLGIVELVPRHLEAELTEHLGPDLLGPDWDEQTALARLTADTDRPVGEALLDQTNLAGIGNMYMAELCFTSGIHPTTSVAAVPDLPRLVRRARLMLEANKTRAIQSTTGDLRPRERMWVYRRDKSPCRRCGTTIQVAMVGPPERQRAAYWCPSCQPARS
ncbi:MAG: Endonuclease VIII [uncultured Nocardioides sp.]|uniref:DNA-(apurinic or apyrimidinic site) lyase n=1 Tax=uncultured Nocardioides sp. TaxID=198441 RepID=A0A6J4NG47_9ACTN|nr:MAG: Endonuclease VIII [uncultured Nocardioides sp.]